jgi:hypothetical protein
MSETGTARRLRAQAVHADLAAVPDHARIGSFERWDSLAHMRPVLALEQKVGRELDAEEVVRAQASSVGWGKLASSGALEIVLAGTENDVAARGLPSDRCGGWSR